VQGVTALPRIDGRTARTDLVPKQAILFSDHVALVMREKMNHLITRCEPAAGLTHRCEFVGRCLLLIGRLGHKEGITCPPGSVKTPQ
jgi:hypothetical protein